jgi:hypothetical protein
MTVRSDRRPQLTRPFLHARGFGAIAAVVLTGACGGNVVVDTTTGSGAAGGQGGAGSTYTGTGAVYNSSSTYGNTSFEAVGAGGAFNTTGAGVGGAGEPSCNPVVAPNEYAATVCVSNQDCSQNYSQQLLSALAKQLGVCDQASGSCCDEPVVGNVDCGPAYMGNSCCYVVTVDKSFACP